MLKLEWMLWPLGALAAYWCLAPFARWMGNVLELLSDIRDGLRKIEGVQEELLREAALASSYLRDIHEATSGREAESADPLPRDL